MHTLHIFIVNSWWTLLFHNWINFTHAYTQKRCPFIIHFCIFSIRVFVTSIIGQVTIEFHVEKETNFIVLHSQELNITEKVSRFAWSKLFLFSRLKCAQNTEIANVLIEYFDWNEIGNCWAQRICMENSKSLRIPATPTTIHRVKRSIAEKNQFHIESTVVFASDTRARRILCRSIWWRKWC